MFGGGGGAPYTNQDPALKSLARERSLFSPEMRNPRRPSVGLVSCTMSAEKLRLNMQQSRRDRVACRLVMISTSATPASR